MLHKTILQFRDFIVQECTAQKDHFILWAPFILSLGIGIYFSLPFEPYIIASSFVLIVSCAIMAVFYQNIILRYFLGALVLLAFGFFLANLRTHTRNTHVLKREVSYTKVIGTIDAVEQSRKGKKGQRLVLSNLTLSGVTEGETPKKVRITFRIMPDQSFEKGQVITFSGKIMPVSPPVIPGGFDFQQYLYFKGIGGIGFSYTKPEILTEPLRRYGIQSARDHINGLLLKYLDQRIAAFAQALMTGERSGISQKDKDAMRDSGLAHILAISGLHIGLFSGSVFFAVRFFLALFPFIALRYPIKKIAALSAFSAALFYAALAGFPIPTQRALITIAIVYLAVMTDRWPFSLRLVAAAAFVVLCIQPESLISVSFQLSFAAVTGLIIVFDTVRSQLQSWYHQASNIRKISLYFLGVTATSIIATVSTAPLVLYHFGQVSTVGVLANMIVVPLMAFAIMPLAVVILFLMFFGFSHWIIVWLGHGIKIILDTAYWFSALPFSVIQMPAMPLYALVAVIIGISIVFLWQGRLRWSGVLIVLFGIYGAITHKRFDILVTHDGAAIGVMHSNNKIQYVNNDSSNTFVLEQWRAYYALNEMQQRLFDGADSMHCDSVACRTTIHAQKVSIVMHPASLQTECPWADIVITPLYIGGQHCRASVYLNAYTMKNNGSYGIVVPTNEQRPLNVIHARSLRGERPWASYYTPIMNASINDNAASN